MLLLLPANLRCYFRSRKKLKFKTKALGKKGARKTLKPSPLALNKALQQQQNCPLTDMRLEEFSGEAVGVFLKEGGNGGVGRRKDRTATPLQQARRQEVLVHPFFEL